MNWSNATCAAMYEVVITRENGLVELNTTTTETAFEYDVPSNTNDCYNISVYSIDYAGRRVGSPVSTRIPIKCEYLHYYNNKSFCSTLLLSYY